MKPTMCVLKNVVCILCRQYEVEGMLRMSRQTSVARPHAMLGARSFCEKVPAAVHLYTIEHQDTFHNRLASSPYPMECTLLIKVINLPENR